MQSFKQDSLSCLLHSSPWFRPLDRSSVPLPSVVASLNDYMGWTTPYPQGHSLVTGKKSYGAAEALSEQPEVDALVFYMLNHAVSVISKEYHPYAPLGNLGLVVNLYREQLAVRSTRMFFYLLMICTRESRHVRNSKGGSFMLSLGSKHGDSILTFIESIRGGGSSGAVTALKTKAPNCMLGAYVRFLQDIFHYGSFSSGYGGKAWGKVTDCLVSYVTGKFSAETMMDTAFTLCHNNGPIFNKGMLFQSYSSEIYKILDVQRSGQIPVFIANHETTLYSHPVVRGITNIVKGLLPELFEGYVDWYKVEALGALKSYTPQKAKQVEKYGAPVGVSLPPQKATDAVKPVKISPPTLFDGQEDDDDKEGIPSLGKFLEIMPGVKVEIVEVR